MSKPRLIAFYLPQFYPTPENDMWWGKGFTEWTNVGKAKPLFKGHYQPKVPADLGYYDLRLPEVREEQAKLAREAGIEGFCYWHYWFGGRRLLDRVFSEVVDSGKPDFPFCLCWANHSWYKKTWNNDGKDTLLMEQTYPGIQDYEAHFYAMLPAFKDPRYMKVNGKLIFGFFAPNDLPDPQSFFDCWNILAKKNGLNGFFFFGYTIYPKQGNTILKKGYDGAVIDYVRASVLDKGLAFRGVVKFIKEYLHYPFTVNYTDYIASLIRNFDPSPGIYPSIDPNFDHSPRSGTKGIIITDSTPQNWGKLCAAVFKKTSFRSKEKNLIFIKAWNEWGEGNYLEPDLKYGLGYLKGLKEVMNDTDAI